MVMSSLGLAVLMRSIRWQDVTVPMLEEVRRRLRALMGLIEPISRDPLYTNFADELGELRELETAALLTRDEFQQFRLRAKDFPKARGSPDHAAPAPQPTSHSG